VPRVLIRADSPLGRKVGLKRDFESPSVLAPSDYDSLVQIAGPQPPISNAFKLEIDLI